MFMQPSGGCCESAENVCWLVHQGPTGYKSLYKSSFADKVKCDTLARKEGCCKTIGPPPKMCFNCPAHFLRKHSRTVPVFFKPEELKVSTKDKRTIGFQNRGRLPELDDDMVPNIKHNYKGKKTKSFYRCEFPKPPSRMGLFRSPREKPYEYRYKLHMPRDCDCDQLLWEDLIEATECAGNMEGDNGRKRHRKQIRPSGSDDVDQGPPKDYIRSNALHAIRMPPRRLRRCYVDKCGVHLIDMSDSPFVLRPGYGKVPAYIYRRKWQLLQEDMRTKQEIQASAVQGLQPVDECEKQMVICGLKEYWGRLLQEYNSIPLSGEGNERCRELKQNLEARMKEVEADLKLLTSTNMLFVGSVNSSQYL